MFWADGFWAEGFWAEGFWEGMTATVRTAQGWTGGGNEPIQAVAGRRKNRTKPLPYYAGIGVQWVGPPMPTLLLRLKVEKPRVRAEPERAHVVYTPRPRLESPTPAPWLPVAKPRVRAGIRFTGPPLPAFRVTAHHEDTEAEAVSVMLAAMLNY